MAVDQNGNHIKGTKKELLEGFVTYGYKYFIEPNETQIP